MDKTPDRNYSFDSLPMATDLTQDCALFQGVKLRARHKYRIDALTSADPNFTDAAQL